MLDSDSSESDRDGSDDDLSDAEDVNLRRAVRERAAADAQRQRQRQLQQQPNRPVASEDVEEEDDDVVLCGDASGGGGGSMGGAPRLVQGVNAGKIGPELAKLRAAQVRRVGTLHHVILRSHNTIS
jgi:hypothetical protein